MTVFATFVIVLFSVTYASVLTLRWFALEFIYDDIEAMWGGTLPNIMVASLLLFIAVAIGYFIANHTLINSLFNNLLTRLSKS